MNIRPTAVLRLRFSLAAFTLFATALPARATVFSNLTEQGAIANGPQQFVQLFNMRDMTPDNHVAQSALGDEALSVLSLTGSLGVMTLNAHACSGPPPFSNAGSASGTGQLYYEEDFVIESATLPIGTPVTIDVKIAAGSSFVGTTSNPDNLPTLDTASITGHANIRIDSNALGEATFIGDFSAGQQGGFPASRAQSGIFGTQFGDPTMSGERRAGEFTATVGGKVGQRFNIAIQTTLSAGSGAGYFSVSDADGQISLLWGADVVGGLAEIRSSAEPTIPFPSTSTVDADTALFYLPPSPVPEPSTFILGALGFMCLAVWGWRRKRSRSISG